MDYRSYAQFLPARYVNNLAPPTSTWWQWRGVRVHISRAPVPEADVRMMLIHGGGGYSGAGSGGAAAVAAAAARAADNEAVDLYQFTSVLMRSLSGEERLKFIELLWEIVYSDGENHELEDNLVWRVAELLGVDGRDRVLLRQAVQARVDDDGEA